MDFIKPFLPLVLAFITCFFGYRMNRILIATSSFVIGFSLGYPLINLVIHSHEICLILSTIIGLIAGFMGFKFYLIGIFILCFLSALSLAKMHIPNETIMWIAGIGGGILLGILGMKFVKPVMIVTTSISGAATISSALPHFFSLPSSILLLVEFVLAILGICFQFKQKEN